MKIIIENEYQGIRIETTPERYESDIRAKNPDFWKWVSVSYEDGSTAFTRRGNVTRRVTIINGRTVYADWTEFFEFSRCDADENPMEYIIRMLDKDFKTKAQPAELAKEDKAYKMQLYATHKPYHRTPKAVGIINELKDN